MLVVAEEEALLAATLVAAHGVDARVLAAAVVELALIHICRRAWVRATATSVYKSLAQRASCGHKQCAWSRSVSKSDCRLECLTKELNLKCLQPTQTFSPPTHMHTST